jgi:hypothetical protein
LVKMGLIGCPETSALNQPALRNNPEDRRIQLNRSGRLRSRQVMSCPIIYSSN